MLIVASLSEARVDDGKVPAPTMDLVRKCSEGWGSEMTTRGKTGRIDMLMASETVLGNVLLCCRPSGRAPTPRSGRLRFSVATWCLPAQRNAPLPAASHEEAPRRKSQNNGFLVLRQGRSSAVGFSGFSKVCSVQTGFLFLENALLKPSGVLELVRARNGK